MSDFFFSGSDAKLHSKHIHIEKNVEKSVICKILLVIRIDTDSDRILGQKYGLPSQKCGISAPVV